MRKGGIWHLAWSLSSTLKGRAPLVVGWDGSCQIFALRTVGVYFTMGMSYLLLILLWSLTSMLVFFSLYLITLKPEGEEIGATWYHQIGKMSVLGYKILCTGLDR